MKKNRLNATKNEERDFSVRYELEVNDVVDAKVLDLGTSGRLPYMVTGEMSEDGDARTFTYHVVDMIPLVEFLKKEVNKKQMLTLLYNILAGLESFGMNMVSLSYVAKDVQYIFVNPDSIGVKFIVAPVDKQTTDLNEVKALIKTILVDATYFDMDMDNYVAKLISFANKNGTFSIADMKEYVEQLLSDMGVHIEKERENADKAGEKPSGKVNRLGVMMNNARMNQQVGGPNGMPGQPPMGMPNGMPNGAPGQPPMGMPNGMPNGAPGQPPMGRPMGMPNGAPGQPPMGMPNGAPGQPPMGRPMGMPNGAPGQPPMGRPMGMPNGAPGQPPMGRPMGMPNGAPGQPPMGMPNGMPGQPPMGMPNGMPGQPPMGRPMGMPNGAPGQPPMGMPNGVPGQPPMGMPNGVPGQSPVGVPNGMPGMPSEPIEDEQKTVASETDFLGNDSKEVAVSEAPETPVAPDVSEVTEKSAEPEGSAEPETSEKEVPAESEAPVEEATSEEAPAESEESDASVAPKTPEATEVPAESETPETEEASAEADVPVEPAEPADPAVPQTLEAPMPGIPVAVTPEVPVMPEIPVPYLLRKKTNEKIYLDKDEFAIGKSATKADYTISDNTAVSRIHCIISKRNGVSYIRDNNSTNGTFVNNEELLNGSERFLTNNAQVTLADEEFIFFIK